MVSTSIMATLLYTLSGVIFVLISVQVYANEVDLILNEIQNASEGIAFGEQKNVILVMGNARSAKSTLTLLLTGAKLEEKSVSSGEFKIVDENNLVSGNQTTESTTKVPILMVDKETNLAFYDCPSFDDSRDIVADMIDARSAQSLLNFTDQIKLLFTVSYQLDGDRINDDRNDFEELTRHVVDLIKNIDKYAKGMALVVTKYQNLAANDTADKTESDDDDVTVIGTIGGILTQIKTDLEAKRGGQMTDEERRLNEEHIKFTNVFLEKNSDGFAKINVFRLVNRPGVLGEMDVIQSEKKAILSMLNHNLDYITSDANDFDYSNSKLEKKLKMQLEKHLERICTDLERFYNTKKPLADRVETIASTIGVQNFFQLHSDDEFIDKFNQSLIRLGIEVDTKTIESMSTNIDLLHFLQGTSKTQAKTISSEIEGKMKHCAKNLLEKVVRNEVLNTIINIQLDYIDRKTSDMEILNKIKEFFTTGSDEVSSTALRSLLELSPDRHSSLSNTIEFLDFLQMLSSPEPYSVNMAGELKMYVNSKHQQTEASLTAEVVVIIGTIQNFYEHLEQQSRLKLEYIAATMSDVHQKLVSVPASSLKDLLQKLFDLDTEYKISSTSSRNEQKIFRTLEILQMIEESTSIPARIVEAMEEFRKYIDESNTWYGFLLTLRDRLLTYTELQSSNPHNNGLYFNPQWMIKDENDNSDVDEIVLQSAVALLNDGRYNDTMNALNTNVFKSEALQAVWSQTTSEMDVSCESNRLIVKGTNIVISKVIKSKCWSTAEFVDIFALNKVVIDTDIIKVGNCIELSIISPVWEIISSGLQREIILSGKEGQKYTTTAKDAPSDAKNGENGLPGNPGGQGGHFVAIGNTFKGNDVSIYVNGGRCGVGQQGGKGGAGIQGENAPPVNTHIYDYMKSTGFWCEKMGSDRVDHKFNGFDDYTYYNCYGKDGIRGGKGGDGGCGGNGGYPGNTLIFGLDQMPRFDISNKTGYSENSVCGNSGGAGGKATRNGNTRKVTAHGWNRPFRSYRVDQWINKEVPGAEVAPGESGKFGESCSGIKPAKIDHVFDPTLTMRRYAKFAREHIDTNNLNSDLSRLVNALAKNETLDYLFRVENLIEDFISLEGQYFYLYKRIDLTPYYELLKLRIERCVRAIKYSVDEQKAVKMLYTAVISKLSSVRSQANQIAVTDLPSYIETVRTNVHKFQSDQKLEHITTSSNKYKESLEIKMKSANELVQTMIVPAIDKTFSETETTIQNLLDEATAKEKQTKEALEKAKENKRKLEKAMLWHKILGPLKAVGGLLGLAGPEGAIAGNVLTGGATFIESVIDGGLEPQKISTPVAPYKKLIEKISNDFMHRQLLFSEQLKDLDVILSEGLTGFDGIQKVVRNLTVEMSKVSKFDKNDEKEISDQLEKGKKAVYSALDSAKSYFDERKKKGEDVDKALDRISKMQKLLKVADVGIDIYKQIRGDNKKLDEVNEQISDLEDQLNTWKLYEEEIKQIMLPQLKEIESAFEKSSKNLEGKSHVELDISKWKIKGALSDLKSLFQKMAKAQESLLEGDLMQCIDKVTEGITTMITVYDHIDTYAEQAKLGALIADVAIGHIEIGDRALQQEVYRLEEIVRSNLIIGQFESVMTALKQHKFPYARQYLDVFSKFPPSLHTDMMANIFDTVMTNLDDLHGELISSRSSLEGTDINTFSNIHFDHARPFYEWHYQDYSDELDRFLSGHPVILASDIRHGVRESAVKFKEISINLKSSDPDQQSRLSQKLEESELIMTIVGNAYYRCSNRIYYLTTEKDIPLVFYIENGMIVHKNEIAEKIFKSDYFLSPYTIWKIQMISKYFGPQPNASLSQSQYHESGDFSLQLTGVGQGIEDKIPNQFYSCDSDLDNFYTLSDIL